MNRNKPALHNVLVILLELVCKKSLRLFKHYKLIKQYTRIRVGSQLSKVFAKISNKASKILSEKKKHNAKILKRSRCPGHHLAFLKKKKKKKKI